MRILSLSETNQHVAAQEVVGILRTGGVAVVPTDTVYGLIGLADSTEAIKKLFAVKKRPPEKSLPVFIKDIPMARRYAYISDAKARMLERIWPGAVTIIVHHKEKLPPELTGGGDTIAMRIPNHHFMRLILSRFDVPVAQTSANISGKPPAKTIEELKEYFEGGEEPDIVVDNGKIRGIASTIIDVTGSDPVMVRMGGTMQEFEELMAKMKGEKVMKNV